MKINHLLLTLFMGLTLSGNAQSYDLTVSTSPYTDLVGSTSLNNGMTWDDPDFIIPLVFDFEFFDQTYNVLSIKGYETGGSLGFSDNENDDSYPMIRPYGADIVDRGWQLDVDEPTVGSLSNISYLLEGVVGSRILKIEWNNVGFYEEFDEDGISSDFTNFQLWLYEGTNDIEVRFGNNSITHPDISFEGETGAGIGLFEEYSEATLDLMEEVLFLSGTPVAPVLNQITGTDANLPFLNGIIPAEMVYKFSPSLGSATSDNANELLKITAYPNPMATQLALRMADSAHQIESVSIRTITGQLLREVIYDQQPIDVSAISAGIYLLEINTSLGVIHKKILKK